MSCRFPGGIGLSMLPRPEKFYFAFAKPVETKLYAKKIGDRATIQRLQKKVANSVNTMMKELLLQKAQERSQQPLLRRVLQKT